MKSCNLQELSNNQTAGDKLENKVLDRLKREMSFVCSYKNFDNQTSAVEKEIEQ